MLQQGSSGFWTNNKSTNGFIHNGFFFYHSFLPPLITPFLSFLLISITHAPNSKPHPFIIPIKKDPTTNVFYTSVGIGTPRHNTELVIDLAGENLWYDCDNHYDSSSYRPISCDPRNIYACGQCHGRFKPGCTNITCGTSDYNLQPLKSFSMGTLVWMSYSFLKIQVHAWLSFWLH